MDAGGKLTEDEAAAAARASGSPVEVLSKRGELTTVRALPTGGFEQVTHLRPVRARKGREWAAIDTSLSRSDGRIVPGVSTVGLKFSAGGSEAPLVEMERFGRKLALSWPGELPEPVLSGDTAEYRGVIGADVDLRVRADSDGFSHTFVVKTAEAAKDPRLAKLAFGLSATRLRVSQDASGLLSAKDAATGAGVFAAPQPLMWDSTAAAPPAGGAARSAPSSASEDGPADGAKTAELAVGLDGGQLTLTPDQGLLTAADTKFPVFIDPVWSTDQAPGWAMVSSGWPDQTYWKFAGKSTEGVGRCEVAKDGNCVKDQSKRIFFKMPLPSIKGRYIEAVEFVAYETDAYNCNNSTSVQLWGTSTLVSHVTWNNSGGAWKAHLASRDVAYCSRAPVEFGGATLRSHIQAAVDKGHTSATFGLRAYSESTMDWWKRFADDAYLKVQYNRPPHQPDTDYMIASPGGACQNVQGKWSNVPPILIAPLSDPDTEDKAKVRGQFTLWWDAGSGFKQQWTSVLTPAVNSGLNHRFELPDTIPQKKLISWGVRAYDGVQYGPWSYDGAQPGCHFYYDPTVPAPPTVTSTDYPKDLEWHDGVGKAGTFTISDANNAAERYDIRMNGVALPSVATVNGAARNVLLAPTRSGPNALEVGAFTNANGNTATTTYVFNARAGQPAKAHFKLDEVAGSTTLQAVGRDGEPAITAATASGATLGVGGQDGTAMQLNGTTGKAGTSATEPVLDTSKSFAVSAWARLDSDARNYTVLSQDGDRESGFFLKYEKSLNTWMFVRTIEDSDEAGSFAARAALPAVIGKWTHLVGVYDAPAKRLRIFVDGEPGTDSPEVTAVWNAPYGFQIGRARWLGNNTDFFPGVIDDVRAYDRIIGAQEVDELYQTEPILAGRWKLNTDGVGEPAGTPSLTLAGGAAIDPDSGFWDTSAGGLLLNGSTAYASLQDPPVSTDRSFTIAGWVRILDPPASPATAFSQAGSAANGVTLRFVPSADPEAAGEWQAEMAGTDAAAGQPFVVTHSTLTVGAWNHVAVVYDVQRNRLSLYVDGALESITDNVSARGGVRGFRAANGGLQVGRSKLGAPAGTEYWPDAIDDLWVYQSALTEAQIEDLAEANELPTEGGP